MSERQPQILDIEQVIRSRAGKKAKYIPQFLINWFKKFMHLDYINSYLKEGYMGVEFCENCIKYLGVEVEVEGLENLPPKDGSIHSFPITLSAPSTVSRLEQCSETEMTASSDI